MQTLQTALAQFGEPYFGYTPPTGGFFLWLCLYEGIQADQIRDHVAEDSRFYPGDDTDGNPQTMRSR